jgi:hypothetical protein
MAKDVVRYARYRFPALVHESCGVRGPTTGIPRSSVHAATTLKG